MKCIALAVCVCLAVSVGRATANPLFESFESDLSAWSFVGDVSIVGPDFGVTPTDGDFQLLLSTVDDQVSLTEIESLLQTSFPVDSEFGLISGVAASITLDVQAGDRLTFDWTYLTNEFYDGGVWDPGFVIIGTPIALADGLEPSLSGSETYFVFESHYQSLSHIFATDGSVTLGFAVLSRADEFIASGMLIDNLRLEAVPEPTALTLLSLSLPSLLLWRRSIRQATRTHGT